MKIKIVKSSDLREADSMAFEDVVGDLDVVGFPSPEEELEEGHRVLVQAHLPHVEQWNRDPNVDLVYLWPGGPLQVGDLVICPPTPLHGATFVAIVTSLDASSHPYKGPAKYLIGRANEVEID